MKLLYIGDVMGEMGLQAVEQVLPQLIIDKGITTVIAQAENVTAGKGMSIEDYNRLRKYGVNGFSGGNHTVDLPELLPLLEDSTIPVTGPANMLGCPGPGYKYVEANGQRTLFVSLLGGIVGKHADMPKDNPLKKIDEILHEQLNEDRTATVINFHGDFSSEKVIIGYYLDGRVSLVVGDHWHVPTADASILPKGTAHITDVGMCGSLDSSLGVTFDSVIPRWRDGYQTKNVLESVGRLQFNAVLITIDDSNGKATTIEQIRRIW